MAANERTNVKTFPTALATDVLFYVLADSSLPKNKQPTYGTSYRDCFPHAAEPFPDHNLVYIAADDGSGKQKWYFAADRENQDTYNYEQDGDTVTRTYIIRRGLYRANPVGFVSAIAGEFLYPPAGAASPDPLFSGYCFVDDTLVRLDRDLDSLYVAVRRRYIRPVTVDYGYDAQFKRNIRITKEIIPKTTSSPALGSLGTSVEIQDGNFYHSVRITKELVLVSPETYPYALPDIPATQDYTFPSKLDSVSLIWAWAYASAAGHRDSYSEDYFFKPRIIGPRPGPYSATVKRWITNDPAAIKTANPITIVPQPVKEAVSVVGWWWYANVNFGNATYAVAKEWDVPSTIHEEITISLGENPTAAATIPPAASQYFAPTIDATPGVTAFLALTEATIDYKVRELPLGLYEVSVVKINCANLYG